MYRRDVFRLIEIHWDEQKYRYAKPFGYRLFGWLRWEYEYELDKESAQHATSDIPSWAQSPTTGIIGTWHAVRRRLVMRYLSIPVWRWRAVDR